MKKAVGTSLGQEIKMRCIGSLQRCFVVQAGIGPIAKTIEQHQNTPFRDRLLWSDFFIQFSETPGLVSEIPILSKN
jgi:hypothetical protein